MPEGEAALTATYRFAGTIDTPDSCSASAAATSPTGKWVTGRFGKANDVDWYRFKLTSTSRVRIVLGDLAVGCSRRAVPRLHHQSHRRRRGRDHARGPPPDAVGRDVRGEGDREERVVVAEVRVHGLAPAQNRGDPQHEDVDRGFHAAARRRGLQQHGRHAPCDGYRAPVQRDRQASRHADGGNPRLEDRITRAICVSHRGQPAGRLREGDVDRVVVRLDEGRDATRGHRHFFRAEWGRPVGGTRDRPQHESRSVDTLRVGVILYNNRAGTLDAIRATTGRTSLGPGATTSFVATANPTGLAPAMVGVRALAYR